MCSCLKPASVETLARRLVPGLEGPIVRSAACLYTNTPDGHFVIDLHPDDPRVAVLSPCSGHGFKFASAIGAAAADLLTGVDRPDLSFFGIARFAGGAA